MAIRTRASGATSACRTPTYPGNPGSDRRLLARIRPRERRPDPHHHEERQQPFQRQRLLLLPRRFAAGQHLAAQREPECDRELRSGPVRLQAVWVFIRRPDSRLHVQGQAVLFRRAGMGQLLRRADQHGGRADDGMRNGDFSQLLGSNPFFSTPQIIAIRLTASRSKATSSRPTCCPQTGSP